MGTVNYTAYGNGMTEREALDDALAQDRDENGHQDGYSGSIGSRRTMSSQCVKQPKPAKKCQIIKEQNKPTFKKVIAIRPINGLNVYDTSSKTKGEAIKKAKEMALKYGCAFHVATEMQAIGHTLLATVAPVKGEMGRWKFWGDAKD
jgi:hypothetical protein